jgi:hypothetical protein
MSRPLALQEGGDDEQRLLQALQAGAPIRLACQFAGVHRDTYYEAVKRRPELAQQAEQARAQAALRNLALVQQAGAEDWRAAAEALKLMFPELFGKNRIEVTGAEGGPVATTHQVKMEISSEDIAAAIRALQESGGDGGPQELE